MVIDAVARAQALVGTRFRPQGRDPSTGLDCVGVVLLAYALPADRDRADYRLRGDHAHELGAAIAVAFRRIARRSARPGDLLMFHTGDQQLHLAIRTADGIVHADARLKQVVERPGEAPWPMIAAYRRRVRVRKAG